MVDTATATKIKNDFGCDKLSNAEFLYFFADMFAGRVQYGEVVA